MIRHAGLVARYDGGFWRGVLIEGASGSGKSDLALRALASGFRLVADDRTVVFASGGQLFGRAPPPLKDRLEIRGLGIMATPARDFTRIVLIARGLPPGAGPDRLPEPAFESLLGVRLPVVEIAFLETSAPNKLTAAMEHLGARGQ